MGWKLLDVQPLFVLPPLAVEVGLNEAIVLQHLYYRAQGPNVQTHDGRDWVQASVETLQLEFPFWSVSTVERTLKALKDLACIESRRTREGNMYTVDTPRTRQLAGLEPGTLTVGTRQVDGTPCKGEEKKEEETPVLFETEQAPVQSEMDRVRIVWEFYFGVFGDRLTKKELTPSRTGMIRKGLKATADDTELLKTAILGLKSYRDSHPDGSKDVTLDAILKTRPGGSNLTDQIEWWAAQAPLGSKGPVVSIPNHLKHAATQHQITVVRFMNRTREIPDDLEAESMESAAWLRNELGIEAQRRDDGTIQWTKIT